MGRFPKETGCNNMIRVLLVMDRLNFEQIFKKASPILGDLKILVNQRIIQNWEVITPTHVIEINRIPGYIKKFTPQISTIVEAALINSITNLAF